ncbi:hypothetical protein [Psychroflexus salis]|uniref:Uncharacterized protein n=1 Tax=Psychroflexus salis TaxID=1526574 RepID=A0A916ZWE2_9FLAO|nr:hypothetical protein [Psychroflexus salis]GGE16880.1 hypothetical protein GCM10010831_17690 [Psychroflexus salis]
MKANLFTYQSEHKKIFEITIEHDYYVSNILSRLEITPTQETKETLRNYELLVVNKKGGIIILGKNSERFSGVSFNNTIKLNFYLKILDPYFLNYTNLPFKVNNKYIFKNTQCIEDEILNNEDFVGESDVTQQDFGNNISGLIEITLNQNKEFFGEKDATKNQLPVQFIIKYTSRTILTRYNLIGGIHLNQLSDFYIKTTDNKIENIEFHERILSNGNIAFSYLDKAAIKIKEHLILSKELKKKDNTLNIYSKHLPEPDIKNIQKDNDINQFIADIFVKI